MEVKNFFWMYFNVSAQIVTFDGLYISEHEVIPYKISKKNINFFVQGIVFQKTKFSHQVYLNMVNFKTEQD